MEEIRKHTLTITPATLKLIAEIDEFKGAWSAIGRISPDRLTALRHIATIESIGSSTRIEGAKLSDKEVEHLLTGLEIRHFASRDEEEVVGYASVMEAVFSSFSEIDLTGNHIRQLHGQLLAFSSKDERHRGHYKTHPNHVEAFDTPRRMEALVAWTNTAVEDSDLHPLIVVAIFVVVFLAIHPFQDGNGRLSRVLTTLLLLRAGYDYVPYSSMESVIERSKDAYYRALRNTQITLGKKDPDWQPWLEFFLRALQDQKASLGKKVERERLVLGDL